MNNYGVGVGFATYRKNLYQLQQQLCSFIHIDRDMGHMFVTTTSPW